MKNRVIGPGAILALTAFAQFAFQVALLARGVEFAASRLTPDDLYYYLQVAWNFTRLGFPTFDGINSTNGVQFLWFWVLVVLSYLSPTKNALLMAALGATALINVAAYYPIWRLGRALGRPVLAVGLGVFWMYLNGRNYLSGLENSLHGLVFWALLLSVVRLYGADEKAARPGRDLFLIGVVSTLLVWTRVDSVFYAVPFYLAAVVVVRRRRPGSWVAATLKSAVVPILGAPFMLAVFHWMGGWPLPVSGLIKSGLYEWSASTLFEISLRGFTFTSPLFDLWRLALPGRAADGVAVALVAATFATIAWAARRTDYLEATGLGRRRVPFLVGVGSGAAHQAYLANLGGYAEHGFWYQSPYFIVCIVVVAVALDVIAYVIGRGAWSKVTRGLPALLGAGVIVAGLGSVGLRFYAREAIEDSPSYYRLETARWISENLEKDAVCASWNAGQLGYFSTCPVVHMEGLVNSIEYYRWKRAQKDVRELDYLLEEDIAYVVDYRIPGHVRDAFPMVKGIEVLRGPKKGRVYQIRKNPRWVSKAARAPEANIR